MLGSRKGLRDASRGVQDMRRGAAEFRIAAAKTPADALALMEKQRDLDLEQAAKHQSKAKGVLNGPAELRAAKAAEAQANRWQRRIDKHLSAHPELAQPASPQDSQAVIQQMWDVYHLMQQGIISAEQYEAKRQQLAAQL